MKTKTIIIIISAIVLAVFIATIALRPPFLHPTLRSGGFQTAIVEIGPVIATELASGIVEPENEVLLLSPASSVILSIDNGVGSKVQPGEAILRLDPKPILNDIEDIEDQLEMKRNNLEKTRLNARGIRIDLDYNMEVKRLKVASLKSELADQKQLLEVGGISPARHEKTKQELVLAEKDIQSVKERNSIRLKQLQAEEEGLKLQIQIQEKELAQKKDLLSKMVIRAPSAGIILEVNGKEGEMVKTDQTLVRMSDLTTYKIRATIDDNQADIIKTGKDVFAVIDNNRLQGKIGTISPVIRDKKLEFDVHLNRSEFSRLRPNLEVELHVVRAGRDSVRRLPNGPALENGKTVEMYKVQNNTATLTEINTGLRGDDYVEIREGAEQGDRLIVSDIGAIRKVKEIEIKP